MNTTQDRPIALPPTPDYDSEGAFSAKTLHDYARAAVEADRGRAVPGHKTDLGDNRSVALYRYPQGFRFVFESGALNTRLAVTNRAAEAMLMLLTMELSGPDPEVPVA
jgi:hypothetical protein